MSMSTELEHPETPDPVGKAEQQSGEQEIDQTATGDAVGNYRDWLSKQPAEVATIVEAHNRNLVSAHERVKTERNQLRQEIENIIRSRTMDSEDKLSALKAALDQEKRRSKFAFTLPATVQDRDLAYIAAEKAGLIMADGSCDLEKLQALHPSLFATQYTPAMAGDGTATPTARPFDMGDWIRQKARTKR